MKRSHVSPADRDYGWTTDRSALAVLKSSYIANIADDLPKRPAHAAGRPNHHPDHVYVLSMALLGVFGSQRQASAWLREPTNWFKVRMHARKHWGVELREYPPSLGTVNYNMVRLSAFGDQIRQKFSALAVQQAQQQGCLVKTAKTMNKPPRANVVVVDGTVPKSRRRAKTLDRLQEEGKLRNPVPKYKEGGEDGNWVSGYKELIMTVRPDDHPNSRIILGVVPVPKEGYGGEAGIAVNELCKLREITKGFLGLRYDGAFAGIHLDAMMKCGVSTITPLPKSDQRRLYANIVCKAGHTHSLYTEGGEFVELELLETGKAHPVVCERIDQFSRQNADGSYRWYANLKLSCGQRRLERLDITEEDRQRKFNRTQVVRMHPPESDEYINTYGWRQDVESVNNNLDTTLYRHRMIVDKIDKQALVMVGFAIARNAISAKVFSERQRRSAISSPDSGGPLAA